ncbi:MAG: AraC family transcriptional regulator [Chitinophagaceae bacterium]|nr:MAG: AraC family transcriptional regulator [Chitinophagaceae bacterium]
MPAKPPVHIRSITEYHQEMGLPKPEHPLISIISFDLHSKQHYKGSSNWVFDFYTIALKRNFKGKIKYGQQEYDFDEGIMTFMSPGQVLRIELNEGEQHNHSGYLLLLHPDFLWNTPLANQINQYEFFEYWVHEALFLSDKEEQTIINTLKQIQHEYHGHIDKFTQHIIVAQLEVLLNYAERFFQRQFITRKISGSKVLSRLEELISKYIESDRLVLKGLPSVKLLSDQLNVSPNYLSALMKALTGKSTQQHVQDKLIEKAKLQLTTTDLSVSEIAYSLGFGHPQSFSKLFKLKTNSSPLEFRASFNRN